MRLAVLGATGALGSNLLAAAHERGHDVVAIARQPERIHAPEGVARAAADARQVRSIVRAAAGCEVLFHCVNVPLHQFASGHPALLANAIDACRQLGARLAFPGNVWIYGPGRPEERIDETRPPCPTSARGRVRAGLERQLRDSGIDFTLVRLPEFYGPNVANRLMGEPFRAALAGRRLTWLGPRLDVACEYIFIVDAARAMLAAATTSAREEEHEAAEVFHVPGACATTPRRFLEEIARAVGAYRPVRALPAALLTLASPFYAPARAFRDILHLWTDPILLDGAKYRARIGPLPRTPYPEGVRETLAWFRANPGTRNVN